MLPFRIMSKSEQEAKEKQQQQALVEAKERQPPATFEEALELVIGAQGANRQMLIGAPDEIPSSLTAA